MPRKSRRARGKTSVAARMGSDPGAVSGLSATDVSVVRVPVSTQRRKTFQLRGSDSINTPVASTQLSFASTGLPVLTFQQAAVNTAGWSSLIASGYDEYRIRSIRVSSQPINPFSITRSVGGAALTIDADNNSPGSPSLTQVLSYTASRQVPVIEHWEIVWSLPHPAGDIWYDVAGMGSFGFQIGSLVLGNDASFSTGTAYMSIAIELIVEARGQFL